MCAVNHPFKSNLYIIYNFFFFTCRFFFLFFIHFAYILLGSFHLTHKHTSPHILQLIPHIINNYYYYFSPAHMCIGKPNLLRGSSLPTIFITITKMCFIYRRSDEYNNTLLYVS